MSTTQPPIPAGLVRSLEQTSAPRVVLIRHADRPELPPGDSGVKVPLTRQGEARARGLGERLGGELEWARTSPLRRCVDTARLVGVEPSPTDLLGAPGPFVVHRRRGGSVFGEHGTRAVVRAYVKGETWGIMRPVSEGVRLVLDDLLPRMDRGGSGLAVTHDAIAIPIIAWVTGHDFSEDWLDPLDGAVLTSAGLTWRGTLYRWSS